MVQWALILCGLYLLMNAAHLYVPGMLLDGDLPLPGADSYTIPVYQRLVQSVATGLVAIGVGAVLFYLRPLHLSRPQ